MAAALGLIVVCVVLWQVWVKPSLSSRTSTVAVPREALALQGLHLKGSRAARVGLMIFSDFECPVCKALATDVLPEVIEQYVDAGQVLLAFSDLPLTTIHPAAFRRARIAECAGRQGRFWEVHDLLFAGLGTASVEDRSVTSLDREALSRCLSSDSERVVRTRLEMARVLGVSSTPTIFVGDVIDGRLRVAEVLVGLPAYEDLAQALDERLGR